MNNKSFDKIFIDENDNLYYPVFIKDAGSFLRTLDLNENLTSIEDFKKNNSIIRIQSSFTSSFFVDKSISKIPLDSWLRVLYLFEFFLSIKYEICIHLYYDSISSSWKFLVPKQSVHSSFVNTQQDSLCDLITGSSVHPSKLKPFVRIGDSHLHPMPLHCFSLTDDQNELYLNGFHILVSTSNNYFNSKSLPSFGDSSLFNNSSLTMTPYSLSDDYHSIKKPFPSSSTESNFSSFNSILQDFPHFFHLGSFTFKGFRYYFDFVHSLIDLQSSFDSSLKFKTPSFIKSDLPFLFFNPSIFDFISFT